MCALWVSEKEDDEKGDHPDRDRDIKEAETGKEKGESAADKDKRDPFLGHRPSVVNT